MKKLLAVVITAAAVSACSTTQARVPVEVQPALEVPQVPPRVIEPAPAPPPPPVEPVGDLPPVSPTNSKPRPQPQRDTTKPETKVEPVAEPVAPPPATPPAQPIVPPLRTPNTPDGNEASRQVREINDRVLKMLNTTDYQALNPERKATYQHAKSLVNLAEDALKAANFEFAKSLAEKAERLAKDLQNR